jgi:hypothetical protein
MPTSFDGNAAMKPLQGKVNGEKNRGPSPPMRHHPAGRARPPEAAWAGLPKQYDFGIKCDHWY